MRNVTFCEAKGMLLPRKTIPFTFKWQRSSTRTFLILPRIAIRAAHSHILFYVHICL